MARISLDPPRTTYVRIGEWYSRRRFGTVLEPSRAMAHNPKVLKTNVRSEMSLAKWDALPRDLRHLAQMASAAAIGCSWCMDFGYWIGINEGMAEAKVRELPRWRTSDAYTDLERRVIAFAEAASATPPEVSDEMVAELRRDLDEAQLVELTMMVAVENQRSRFNSAMGLTSQGFADRCELAPPAVDR